MKTNGHNGNGHNNGGSGSDTHPDDPPFIQRLREQIEEGAGIQDPGPGDFHPPLRILTSMRSTSTLIAKLGWLRIYC